MLNQDGVTKKNYRGKQKSLSISDVKEDLFCGEELVKVLKGFKNTRPQFFQLKVRGNIKT